MKPFGVQNQKDVSYFDVYKGDIQKIAKPKRGKLGQKEMARHQISPTGAEYKLKEFEQGKDNFNRKQNPTERRLGPKVFLEPNVPTGYFESKPLESPPPKTQTKVNQSTKSRWNRTKTRKREKKAEQKKQKTKGRAISPEQAARAARAKNMAHEIQIRQRQFSETSMHSQQSAQQVSHLTVHQLSDSFSGEAMEGAMIGKKKKTKSSKFGRSIGRTRRRKNKKKNTKQEIPKPPEQAVMSKSEEIESQKESERSHMPNPLLRELSKKIKESKEVYARYPTFNGNDKDSEKNVNLLPPPPSREIGKTEKRLEPPNVSTETPQRKLGAGGKVFLKTLSSVSESSFGENDHPKQSVHGNYGNTYALGNNGAFQSESRNESSMSEETTGFIPKPPPRLSNGSSTSEDLLGFIPKPPPRPSNGSSTSEEYIGFLPTPPPRPSAGANQQSIGIKQPNQGGIQHQYGTQQNNDAQEGYYETYGNYEETINDESAFSFDKIKESLRNQERPQRSKMDTGVLRGLDLYNMKKKK